MRVAERSAPALRWVFEIVAEHSGHPIARLTPTTAIDQDLRITGGDVADLAEMLADEFGEHVWSWPWGRFTALGEGLSPLFPFVFTWQLLTWPFRGSFAYPSEFERLELGHIAAVIERGEWFEP